MSALHAIGRAVLLGERRLLTRSLTVVCSRSAVVHQKRHLNFNPFNWKNDEKATPKQREL